MRKLTAVPTAFRPRYDSAVETFLDWLINLPTPRSNLAKWERPAARPPNLVNPEVYK
ncbi:MAG: hypothetical protein HY508_03805 [Acidobacteria bacterium]|nr:hypothetical protein [Acidobacteriota bacterium]